MARRMLKAFKFVLLLPLLSSQVVAQTTDACKADVRYLKLPERALIDDVLGLSEPPVVFLFSQDGFDFYSATDFKATKGLRRLGLAVADAFTIIVVYQDERARRKQIESLQVQYPYSHFEDLKFSTWRFELTPVWIDNVLRRKWLVSGMAFFKPVSCEPAEAKIPLSSQGYLEASINCHNRIVGQMPPMTIPENQRLPAAPNTVMSRAVDAMRELLKSNGLPN